jgi:uncharacterized protein
MSEPLPESVDVERLARDHSHLAGTVTPGRMPRLVRAVAAADDAAWVELQFAMTEQRPRITGRTTIDARLTCQRCLEPANWPLRADIALVLPHTEDEARALPAGFGPLFWPSGSGSLAELVEDEFLLALPVVARHADRARCGPVADQANFDNGVCPPGESPFAALKQLKSGGRGH